MKSTGCVLAVVVAVLVGCGDNTVIDEELGFTLLGDVRALGG